MAATHSQFDEQEIVWAWLALSLVSGLGYKTIKKLTEKTGDVFSLLHTPADILKKEFNLNPKLANRISKARDAQSYLIERRLVQETEGMNLYCPASENYPKRLLEISTPPSVLYWKGSLEHAEKSCLAFVGSRGCTAYGRQQTHRLIKELAQRIPDLVIVSGLARGIDTVAHEAALEFGLKTIAVLAGGLQHVYPPENKKLAEEIQKHGAIVSEFPLGVKPLARNFPIRNRVISGLSLGTVITEARKKSGANITAAFALQQNREVFALPGRVDSIASEGTNFLISRQHAKLVIDADSILEELRISESSSTQLQLPLNDAKPGKRIKPDSLGENQCLILKTLNEGIEEIDLIHEKTGIEMSVLLATLLELELTELVENIGGQIFRLTVGLDLDTKK